MCVAIGALMMAVAGRPAAGDEPGRAVSAADALARAADLTQSTASLPSASNADRLKRVVIELALERAKASVEAGDLKHADRMLDDARRTLSADAVAMAQPTTGAPNIRATRPLIETTPQTNPYLKRLNDGAALFLTGGDSPWKKNTAAHNVLADFNLARRTAAEMDTLLWVFAHPQSNLRHDPEILRRLLRRTYAFLDAIAVHGPSLKAGQLASFYDDFAIAPASTVFREFAVLYPGLIPPHSRNDWDRALLIAADNLWAAHGNRKPTWVNTDVAIAVEFINLSLVTGRSDMLHKARAFVDAVLTSGQMFDDGAVGYIWTQNESGGYQSTVANYVTHFYDITRHPPALQILRRMEWYAPINGPMIDWWTSPSWKHAWNFISGPGLSGESTDGKNPYVRAALDAAINAPATRTNWIAQHHHVAWYQQGVKPLDRPDYHTFDRNIQGPRLWHGLWNVTGTLRNIHDNEPGHHTLIGCQIMESAPASPSGSAPTLRVNAAMMGIFPRLRIAPQPSRDNDGSFNPRRHAWLASKLVGDSTVTPDFSSLAASYKLHIFGSSKKGKEHDWTARQVWLNLPDRSIGLLDLSPNSPQKAFEVQAAIRLGFGGTAHSTPKSLTPTGPASWTYGNLAIHLHDHNYAAVHEDVYAFRRPAAPITEITLRDQPDGSSNTKPRTYQPPQRWHLLAELRPTSTITPVRVTPVADAQGLIGFTVTPADNRKGPHFLLLFNPTSADIVHQPAPAPAPGIAHASAPQQTIRIHHSGSHFRPDWLPDPTGPLPAAILQPGQSITIKPGAHVVLQR
jgi:hypothetical protein